MTQISPYIGFNKKTRDAMEFYKTVFGGKLTINTFKDFHASQTPEEDDLVMHSQLDTEKGLIIMGTDAADRAGTNITVALTGEDEEEIRGYWEKLAVGAVVEQPLEKAAWGDIFGMLIDSFGIHWMVNIIAKKS